ncbi:N-acetyltransferase [Staphylococcus condimenti]|uniref:N-acetyltransferase n=1 Tax=Staphylococcus condimenti TaxID=70255 RepID=A0A143PD41_9STAP|nr:MULTISPECIES: GNAT family N-acetyltransferase [Staphylococcus]AMY06435.1 acetyltransferase [Staphylococcus condimenti]APR60317.1 GNAT family N-acetyltransferase [Staphylococcus condimenti]MDK8644221.1 GNAT family N-acetyltransferase [Staphylococcus condimenti]OFP00279.1 acetyltransferase [Staphylococcus sp. HMSC065E08]PNZ61971.1 N-acetyltransferase [Staphylococcus condimenti]
MEVKHGTNKFYIGENEDNFKAQMTYVPTNPEMFIIDHTEVSDELRGQGAGYKMVEAAVNYARETNKKIVPLCPFAKSVFDKTPEYADVLKK